MRLELAGYPVRDVRFGSGTTLGGGVLTIDRSALRALLAEDPVFADVDVDLARPGERVRIVHLLDTVEPRLKVSAPGSDFPGFLSPPVSGGEGRTNRLAGVAVMQTAVLPQTLGGLNVKDAIVDMAGPLAALSPFSRTLNVVLRFTVREGLTYTEYDAAIRRAGLRAAVYLAETTRGLAPDEAETFELGPAGRGLPRVAYICLLHQEGEVHHVFVYGRVVDETPTLLHPNEFFDGGVVCGSHHMGADRTPTWVYQNHPVVGELYRRHGRDLVFAGVVITKCLSSAFFDKQRSASYAAKLTRLLGANGVVITGGCAGHGIADLMLNCQQAERQGLRTALTCFEMAGDRGNEFGFVTFVPEADAVVSTGNMDEVVEFPEMDRVIGGEEIIDIGNYEGDGGSPAVGPFKAALRRLYAASSMGGAGRMTARPA